MNTYNKNNMKVNDLKQEQIQDFRDYIRDAYFLKADAIDDLCEMKVLELNEEMFRFVCEGNEYFGFLKFMKDRLNVWLKDFDREFVVLGEGGIRYLNWKAHKYDGFEE